MTPEQWAKNDRRIAREQQRALDAHYKSRHSCAFPPAEALRPAEARDIKERAIIYYPNKPDPYWMVVSEVLRPDDDFKAYCADDGCRYGLDGAFVLKKARRK